jgi:hypothetical protein
MEKGEIPYSELEGQPLFHKPQLDEYLLSLQSGQTMRVNQTNPLSTAPEVLGGSTGRTRPSEAGCSGDGTEAPNDFMAEACRLWDDGQEFLVKAGEKGASCQFKGRPRLWVFPEKFQVPAKGKGNEIYVELRKALADHFPHVISRATVRITASSFSRRRFVEFVGQVKDICCRKDQEVTAGTQSHGMGKLAEPSIHDRCIRLWEDPPAFTTTPGVRGCSARHNNRPRLWFFPDCVKIPTEGQGNGMFKSIKDIKDTLFPNAGTKTRVDIGGPGFDLDRLYTFVTDVKKVCATRNKKQASD